MQSISPAPKLPPPRAVGAREFARLIGISVTTLYRMMDADEVQSVKIRGKRLFPVSEVDRLLNRPRAA